MFFARMHVKLFCMLFFLFAFLPLGSVFAKKWLFDLRQGLRLAHKSGQPILLDIYAPWCGYCRRLQQQVYPSPEVSAIGNKFVRIRINGEKNPQIMQRYSVSGFPTILLLDKNGVRLDRINGFITSSALARRLRDVHRRADGYKQILKRLADTPHSLYWNYKAGSYYFEMEAYARARRHFLRAWKGSQGKRLNASHRQKRKRALYNSAVSSMHLDKYSTAAHEWGLYLKHYPQADKDYTYARYYRGLSFYYQGKKRAARADLVFASQHLRNSQERYTAHTLLGTIP